MHVTTEFREREIFKCGDLLCDSLLPKETTFLNSRASHTRMCTSNISSGEIIF
jgi:hypothetical protein